MLTEPYDKIHLSMPLQGPQHVDQLGSIRRRYSTSDFKNGLQLIVRNVANVQLQKTRPERSRQLSTPTICASRILSGKQLEVWVGLDSLLQLGHIELPVIIEQPAHTQAVTEDCDAGLY